MKTILSIQTGLADGRTKLTHSYATSPLKIANITEDKKAEKLHLMIMSSSPGILNGDDYQLTVNVSDGSELVLSTQSYQRLFQMRGGASQSMNVRVGDGASLIYIPHPTVPHSQSSFKAINNITLQPTSQLIWGEIITCGRKNQDEQFLFTSLQIVTEVYVNKRMVLKENLLVEPVKVNVQAIGQWEGYTHQASLIIINPLLPSQTSSMITKLLSQQKDILFGMTEPAVNGLVVRFLGNRGEQLYSILQEVAKAITVSKINFSSYAV